MTCGQVLMIQAAIDAAIILNCLDVTIAHALAGPTVEDGTQENRLVLLMSN